MWTCPILADYNLFIPIPLKKEDFQYVHFRRPYNIIRQSVHLSLVRQRKGVSMRRIILAGIIVAAACSGFAQTDRVKAGATDTNVIGVVLGKKITAKEKDQLNGLIFGALLQQYAKENQIKPTDEELDAFVRRTEEKEKQHQAEFEQDRKRLKMELESSSLSDRDRKDKQSQLATVESILKSDLPPK